MRKRYYVVFMGRVQGVGFRYTAQSLAMRIGLGGYARNLENGNVEMEVEGEEADFDRFLMNIREGNRFISVEDYSVKEIPLENESTFRIKY